MIAAKVSWNSFRLRRMTAMERKKKGPSWFFIAVIALPFLCIPAFFLHPRSFVWVCARWISDLTRYTVGGTRIAIEIIREGNLPTFVVLFWIIALLCAFLYLRRVNLKAQLHAKEHFRGIKRGRKNDRRKSNMRFRNSVSRPLPSIQVFSA